MLDQKMLRPGHVRCPRDRAKVKGTLWLFIGVIGDKNVWLAKDKLYCHPSGGNYNVLKEFKCASL